MAFYFLYIFTQKLILRSTALMSNGLLIDFLQANQKAFVFFFCVLFGVISQESYQMLKNENSSIKKFLPKSVVALFVCLLAGGFMEGNPYLNKYYPYVIMLMAFLHRPASDWIMKDFFPFLSKQLTKNTKPTEDE